MLLAFLISNCEYQPYSQGKTLYEVHCANCHMEDGIGLRGLIPPLAHSDFLEKNQTMLPCLLKNGIKGPIEVNGKIYDTEMIGIKTLNDVQINNIINYINHSWGNNYGVSNIKKVEIQLKECNSK